MVITVYNNTLAREALTSALRPTGTVNGTAVDTAVFGNNCREVLFIITTSTMTNGSHVITVEESDTVGSGYTAVDPSRVMGTLPTMTNTDSDTFFSFSVRPIKRYVRLVTTITAGATGGIYSAKALMANGNNHPVTRS